MRTFIAILAASLLVSCAAGPTPERIGFNYPEGGVRFSPRRHVVSDTLRGTVASSENAPYVLLFPRTKSDIERPQVRLLTTGIVGEWDVTLRPLRPLYDEISNELYQADVPYEFTLTEEREIELPWSGLTDPNATMRIFRMDDIEGDGSQYCFTVIVEHYGNTIEFCWRDGSGDPPDEQKLETFFHWTYGLRFSEPEAEE